MIVNRQELWEAVKNVATFSQAKSLAGGVRISFQQGALEFATSDDVVGVTSWVDGIADDGDEDGVVFITHSSVKALEKKLREMSDEELDVDVEFFGEGVVVDYEWWDGFDYIFSASFVSGEFQLLLDPDAFRKLSMLEPKGKYPASFERAMIAGQEYAAVKYGPKTTVVIAPLDPEVIAEKYDLRDVMFAPWGRGGGIL